MNKDFLIILSIPIVIAITYISLFENPDLSFYNVSPREFITSTQKYLFPEKEETTNLDTGNFLDELSEKVEDSSIETQELEVKTAALRTEYLITFKVLWSQETHPYNFPSSNAHFSPPVAWSHNESFKAFTKGEPASIGIERMAELGGTITLEKELQESKENGFYKHAVGGRAEAPGETSLSLELRDGFELASLVSMIAPSPDWFIAVEAVRLFEDGDWVSEKIVQVKAYDAGTEEGRSFSINNPATDPKDPIALLEDFPFEQLPPLLEITFTKK